MICPDRRILLAGMAAVVAVGVGQPARAEQAIRIIVPFSPGGGTDIVARFIAEKLSQKLGQAVIVDNRPGANGAIAGEVVKNAAADGQTLLVATLASFAAAPALGVKLPYNVATDFVPVGMLGLFPLVICAGPHVPAKNFTEFTALARQNPGKFSYASAGVGSTNQLVWELVAEKVGIKLAHIPYKGASPAASDVMGGRVEIMVDSLAASLPHIKAGRLTGLAVLTGERHPQAPDIATLRENGIDLIYPGWAALVARHGTPRLAVDRFNSALNDILRAPETVERYNQLVIMADAMMPEEAGDFMTGDRETLTRIVRTADIKVQD